MKELTMSNGVVVDARRGPCCEACGRPLARVDATRGVWACYRCSTRYRVRQEADQ